MKLIVSETCNKCHMVEPLLKELISDIEIIDINNYSWDIELTSLPSMITDSGDVLEHEEIINFIIDKRKKAEE